ncbi:MAG TPA: RNA polymerase sigma factor [Sphingomicrobium sp.]|nr:RNA polymerase sigma factor [Sphingomicrobium sp.]
MDEDLALARAAASGDAAAFARLVRTHEAAIRRFLTRLAGHSADDLAQEAFLRAWRLAGTFKGSGSYKSWLMGIAWTQFLASRRSDKRRAEREGQWKPEAAPPSPDRRIDIQRALSVLGERERAAALLCFGEGCSHSEAAAIMDIPLGSLKSIVARARSALAAQLETAND